MAGRNLVVFCDGTSDEVGIDQTNVLKLYRLTVNNEDQLSCYIPGVGTNALSSGWSPLSDRVRLLLGLGTGWGIDANIAEAYGFLVRHYRPDDRIFLFGFSRGAYTVRAVAALIQLIGLLHPSQVNLIDYGVTAYKRAGRTDDLGLGGLFQRTLNGRRVPVHFLGVWDTVASVLVPRPDRLFLPTNEVLPYTRSNPSVRCFRHACAIDERRSMFRPLPWRPDQLFQPDRFGGPPPQPQDARTLWFAGVHCDIGGGYPESQSGAAKFALAWMAGEARINGLVLNESLYPHLVLGETLPGGREFYAPPSAKAPLHNSMRSFWPLVELIPKPGRLKSFPGPSTTGLPYLPLAEPRFIAADALVHSSVVERKALTDYAPINLPASCAVVSDAASPAPPRRRRRSAA